MAFNPKEHLMSLKGKDYLQVMWRLVWFRDEKPDWSIETKIIEMDAEHAVFQAMIYDDQAVPKSCAHGSESKRDFGDFIEKAETKAVGRALAMLGYGTQFTASELDEGERIVDSPVQLGSREAAQEAGKKKLAEVESRIEAAKNGDMAAPGQVAFIKANLTEEELKARQAKFGDDLEKMTRAEAEKMVAALQKRIAKANAGH